MPSFPPPVAWAIAPSGCLPLQQLDLAGTQTYLALRGRALQRMSTVTEHMDTSRGSTV